MVLSVGNKVVYPCQGPCVVERVVQKSVGGRLTQFYHLVVLDEPGGELFLPVDKAHVAGLRQLMEKSEVPKLLGQLKKETRTESVMKTAKNWRQRCLDNTRLFNSGSAFDLAELIETLTKLSRVRSLLPRDRWILERARKLLVAEISEVMGEARSAVETQIDKALERGRRNDATGGLSKRSAFGPPSVDAN